MATCEPHGHHHLATQADPAPPHSVDRHPPRASACAEAGSAGTGALVMDTAGAVRVVVGVGVVTRRLGALPRNYNQCTTTRASAVLAARRLSASAGGTVAAQCACVHSAGGMCVALTPTVPPPARLRRLLH